MTIQTTFKQPIGGVTGTRGQPGWLTDGRSVVRFEEPALDLVLRICCAPNMCWIEEPSSLVAQKLSSENKLAHLAQALLQGTNSRNSLIVSPIRGLAHVTY